MNNKMSFDDIFLHEDGIDFAKHNQDKINDNFKELIEALEERFEYTYLIMLKLYFGIEYVDYEMTYEEIAKELNLTTLYVKQKIGYMMKCLKNPSRKQLLRDILLKN